MNIYQSLDSIVNCLDCRQKIKKHLINYGDNVKKNEKWGIAIARSR